VLRSGCSSRPAARSSSDLRAASTAPGIEALSAHWLADARFARAIEDYLAREGQGIARYVDELCEHSPFKETPEEK